MVFNSLEFLIFATLFFAGWPLLRRRATTRWAYLAASSFFFYGWWDFRFLFLLLGNGIVDFLAARWMERFPRRKKLLLVASLSANLASLVAFKYGAFLAQSLDGLLALVGSSVRVAPSLPPALSILPIGISFYTFMSMSYTIDVYRGHVRPTPSVLHYFAYLSLFPHLVAGPIMRADHLLPQLCEGRATTEQERWEGLLLIVGGFAKKVIVADNLAGFVNRAFESSTPNDGALYWWAVITMFAVQIYCDFSGYSDIARGLAKWMGYEFVKNFDHPYTAASLREFWARWHVSLSTWFRDYVYVPLGGGRGRTWRRLSSLWITMALSGLWHGAAWTFVAWGAIHASFLTLERATRWPERVGRLRFGRTLATLLVLAQVWVGWVWFRSASATQAWAILQRMFGFRRFGLDDLLIDFDYAPLFITAAAVAVEIASARGWWRRLQAQPQPRALMPALVAVAIVACVMLRGPGNVFIYFQF